MSSLNQPQEQAKQSDSSEDLQVRKGKTPVKTEGRRTARTPPEATGDEFERKISREDLRGKKGVPFKYRRQPRKAKLKEDQKQDSKHSSEGKKLMSMSSNSLETDTETTQRSEKQKKKLKKKGSEDPRFTALPCDDKNVPAGAMYMKRMIGDDERPLKRQMYYHGLLPRDQIERMLKKNGEFLVRETEVGTDNRLVPTLSVHWNGIVKHFIIGHTKTSNRYHIGFDLFDSVKDLVDWYQSTGRPLMEWPPVVLRHPVARQSWQLTHSQVQKTVKLGEGAFGEVFKGVLITGTRSEVVAVKVKSRPVAAATDNKKERLEFINEFRTMRNLDHPNVLKVLGIAAEEEPVMIVMEFMQHGSLLSYLRGHTIYIQLRDRVRFSTEAVAGLKYLEKNKCMHRDVAARNCLLGPNKEIKIADFGLSRFDAIFQEGKGRKLPIRWLAPETLRTGTYTMANDVWSYGVLLWELFADGAEPYPGMSNSQVRQQVTGWCYRMKPPSIMPPYIAKIMLELCWNEEPLKRPSFEKLHRKFQTIYKTYL